jgi:mono/diheme cytochrome c family protein
LQLSPDRDPLAPHADDAAALNLRTLAERGLVQNLPQALLVAPPRIAAASPAERAALGYLHGNCGNCHNDEGPLAVLEMTLAQRVAAPASSSNVLNSIVGVESQFRARGAPAGAARIAPGHESVSVIALRMSSRDPLQQMPPLGTTAIDAEALRLIGRWIESLPRPNTVH